MKALFPFARKRYLDLGTIWWGGSVDDDKGMIMRMMFEGIEENSVSIWCLFFVCMCACVCVRALPTVR